MGDEMPADPFREGQIDWGWLAGQDAAFLSAHVAAGMSEAAALELTKAHMQFWLGIMLANSAVPQQPQPPGEEQAQGPGGV